MAGKRSTIDMTTGNLPGKILLYAVPLALTYLLQLAFHAADMVVIGRWGSPESLAAIGATHAILGLLLNVVTGISTGANVLAAHYYGAKDSKNMTRLVHTTIAAGFIGGIAVAVIGTATIRFLVTATGIPVESQSRSIQYLLLCFIGVPFQIIYNFGCAILRAVGDTKAPLYFLCMAGTLNVVLNVIMVVCFKMDVAGVAIATAISQILSAYLVLRRLHKYHGSIRLIFRNIRIEKKSLKGILRIGLPAGLQSGCFSVSNIVVQSGINTFGVAAVAGMTAGMNLESLLYSLNYAMHHTCIAVVGQNFGAKEHKRVIRSIYICMAITTAMLLVAGSLMSIFAPQMVSIFSSDPEVIKFGVLRAHEMFVIYFVLGFMDTSSGALRGMGKSLLPAISVLMGTCVLRILWVKYVFPHFPTLEALLLVYPVSWGLVATLNITVIFFVCRKLVRPKNSRWVQISGN